MMSEKTYLTSPRDRRMIEGVNNDWAVLQKAQEEDAFINPLDHTLAVLGTIDTMIGTGLESWTAGESRPKQHIKQMRKNFAAVEKTERRHYEENADFLATCGAFAMLDVMEDHSLYTVKSERIQGYKPSFLEIWTRRGSTYAARPVLEQLITRSRQPVNGPGTEAVDETIVRLACVSEALRAMWDVALNDPRVPAGKQHYIRSLGGLLLEYDALGYFLENTEQQPGVASWAVPCPPNLDFGPNNKYAKADIAVLHFVGGKPGYNYSDFYDVKADLGKRGKQRTKKEDSHGKTVTKITARELGCVGTNEDGTEVIMPGRYLDRYIADRNEQETDRRLESKLGRVVFGLSVLKESLPVLHKNLHILSSNQQCELPSPYTYTA